ncbi:MAG: repeat protein [Actinomycetota bacterium]|nr:repeat protein [Actinomycetota bacterium]
MTASTVLLIVLIIQVEALVGLLVLQGHGALGAHRAHRRAPAVDSAQEIVLRSVFEGRVLPDTVPRLRRLPPSVRTRLLGELGTDLTGGDRELLAQIADSAGVLRRARKNLRNPDWRVRLTGLDVLAALEIRHRRSHRFLSDPAPAVRAAAAQWVSDTEPHPDSLAAVADLLNDPHPTVRFAARVAVISAGQRAADLLLDCGQGPTCPSPTTLLSLAVPGPGFTALALSVADDPDPRARRAAAAVLGQDESPEAVAGLGRMLDSPDATVRRAAVRALGGSGRSTDVRTLARLAKNDPDGLVRESCLRALPELGTAGRLALEALAAQTVEDTAAQGTDGSTGTRHG